MVVYCTAPLPLPATSHGYLVVSLKVQVDWVPRLRPTVAMTVLPLITSTHCVFASVLTVSVSAAPCFA